MEAMLGISLNSYLYPKLTKPVCISFYHLCFIFNKIKEEEGRTVPAWNWGGDFGGWG
jgi:hypothetical protein